MAAAIVDLPLFYEEPFWHDVRVSDIQLTVKAHGPLVIKSIWKLDLILWRKCFDFANVIRIRANKI